MSSSNSKTIARSALVTVVGAAAGLGLLVYPPYKENRELKQGGQPAAKAAKLDAVGQKIVDTSRTANIEQVVNGHVKSTGLRVVSRGENNRYVVSGSYSGIFQFMRNIRGRADVGEGDRLTGTGPVLLVRNLQIRQDGSAYRATFNVSRP